MRSAGSPGTDFIPSSPLGVGTQLVRVPDNSNSAPYSSDIRLRTVIPWLRARRALMIDQTAASYGE
jgi:hypothetical protein